MKGRCMSSVRNQIVFVLLLIGGVSTVRAEYEPQRIAKLQAELQWVGGELRTIDSYDDSQSRESLENEVERLEQERSKLLRVMPEHVDPAELFEQLTWRASAEGLEVHANEPEITDHGDFKTVTIHMKLEGRDDEVQQFVRRLRRSAGAKRVTVDEREGDAHVIDVTAFMVPRKTAEVRSCSVPPSSPDESERESSLRARLISWCAELRDVDPKLRTAILRKRQLEESIRLTSRLFLEASPPEPIGHASGGVAGGVESVFGEEATDDLAGIFEEPVLRDDPEPEEPVELDRAGSELGAGDLTPMDDSAAVDKPEPSLEERHELAEAMSDMRWIATAVDAYAVDHGGYPETSDMARLATTLEKYVAEAVGILAQTDPWSRPYRWISDGDHYRIVSGGWDKRIEEASLVLSGQPHPNDDIVYENNGFQQLPLP